MKTPRPGSYPFRVFQAPPALRRGGARLGSYTTIQRHHTPLPALSLTPGVPGVRERAGRGSVVGSCSVAWEPAPPRRKAGGADNRYDAKHLPRFAGTGNYQIKSRLCPIVSIAFERSERFLFLFNELCVIVGDMKVPQIVAIR